MKAAFVTWNDRIAPVFDVARKARVVALGSDPQVEDIDLPEGPQEVRAAFLADRGVEFLICGAISRPVEALLAAFGIRVVAFVSGATNEVIEAWARGDLAQSSFVMPGCGRRARGRRWAGPWQEVGAMWNESGFGKGVGRRGAFAAGGGWGAGRGAGGMGAGGGRGAGRGGGRGAGRGGAGPGRRGAAQGGLGMGPDGGCVCPECGFEAAHRPGVPCQQEVCPKCGAAMVRK